FHRDEHVRRGAKGADRRAGRAPRRRPPRDQSPDPAGDKERGPPEPARRPRQRRSVLAPGQVFCDLARQGASPEQGDTPMRIFGYHAMILSALVGCTQAGSAPSATEDGENATLQSGTFNLGLTDGTPEACGVLHVASTAEFSVLYDDVYLSYRVA